MSTRNSTSRDDAMLAALPGISPKGLLEAIEDPTVIEKTCRADAYVQLGVLRAQAGSSSFTIAQRLQYLGLLAKLAKLDRTDTEAAAFQRLPTINIVFPGAPERSINYEATLESDDSALLESPTA